MFQMEENTEELSKPDKESVKLLHDIKRGVRELPGLPRIRAEKKYSDSISTNLL